MLGKGPRPGGELQRKSMPEQLVGCREETSGLRLIIGFVRKHVALMWQNMGYYFTK